LNCYNDIDAFMNNNNEQGKIIEKLYHYVKFNCERLGSVIIQHKLYFCSSDAFNDPFDSKIQFTYQGCTDDELRFVYHDYTAKSYREKSTKEVNREVEKNIKNGAYRQPAHQKKFRSHAKTVLQPEINKFGLLCLSEERDDILMWAHYANDHKGVCLEFDKEVLENHFRCRQVLYGQPFARLIDFYRHFLLASEQEGQTGNEANEATENAGRFIFCRKSAHWCYEREWRIIISRQEIESQNGDRAFPYPEGMLTGIILGCNTDEAELTIIDRLLSGRSERPKLYKARTNDDEFKLDLEELNASE
jgi:Protein of unknown function (DUF2971)